MEGDAVGDADASVVRRDAAIVLVGAGVFGVPAGADIFGVPASGDVFGVPAGADVFGISTGAGVACIAFATSLVFDDDERVRSASSGKGRDAQQGTCDPGEMCTLHG